MKTVNIAALMLVEHWEDTATMCRQHHLLLASQDIDMRIKDTLHGLATVLIA